jgi:hypothetical protein
MGVFAATHAHQYGVAFFNHIEVANSFSGRANYAVAQANKGIRGVIW